MPCRPCLWALELQLATGTAFPPQVLDVHGPTEPRYRRHFDPRPRMLKHLVDQFSLCYHIASFVQLALVSHVYVILAQRDRLPALVRRRGLNHDADSTIKPQSSKRTRLGLRRRGSRHAYQSLEVGIKVAPCGRAGQTPAKTHQRSFHTHTPQAQRRLLFSKSCSFCPSFTRPTATEIVMTLHAFMPAHLSLAPVWRVLR